MPLSLYTRLSNLVTAAELASPLRSMLTTSMTLSDAICKLDQDDLADSSLICLVKEDEHLIGWTRYWDIVDAAHEISATVEGATKPSEWSIAQVEKWQRGTLVREINADLIATADTPAWNAFGLVSQSSAQRFFVLAGNEIVGTLSYEAFFKPAFRVCLFALVVELERELLRLCLQEAEARWNVLSDGDHERIRASFQRAHPQVWCREGSKDCHFIRAGIDDRMKEDALKLNDSPQTLLEYSTFGQRKKMVLEHNLLPRREFEKKLEDAVKIRNFCAHPASTDEVFLERGELRAGIEGCQQIIAWIRSSIEDDG